MKTETQAIELPLQGIRIGKSTSLDKYRKIVVLAQKLAGDKWSKVLELSKDLALKEDKTIERALADTLETLKLLPKQQRDEELDS